MPQAWATGALATNSWAEGAWEQEGNVPVITTLEPSGGAVDVAYSFTFQATGDVPITWTVTVGAVPAGLSLATNGALTGTPTGTGTTNFTVQAENSQGTDTLACSLVVGTAATGDGAARDGRREVSRGMQSLSGRG